MTLESEPDAKREFALQVVRQLREAGFEALWAGGCVRDLLLGKSPKDYDVATNAKPEQVQKLFRRTLAIGASFGVIQVVGPKGADVEVATFRSDGEYADGRHPVHVTFSNAQADAQRRDFTINGMFFDPIQSEVIDYVGGKQDLERRVIRAIGDPSQRFEEDKLRMLRAVRFASTLEFELDPRTGEAIRNMADQLNVVSAERILAELQRMLAAPTRVRAVRLLQAVRLLEQIDPLLAESYAVHSDRMESVLGRWTHPVSFSLAVAGLLTGVDDEHVVDAAENLMRRLKASNEVRKRTLHLCANRNLLRRPQEQELAKLKRLRAQEGFDELLDLTEAIEVFETGRSTDADYCRRLAEQWSPDDYDPPPLLTGRELIEAGLTPGPEFKPILDELRDAQLNGGVTTADEAIQLMRQLIQDRKCG